MKKENHPWLQNIQYLLQTIGMGNIWQNPALRDKNYIKKVITERLQDVFRQKYEEYTTSIENNKKCTIINICNSWNEKYEKKGIWLK
jgi:hypothetical protein